MRKTFLVVPAVLIATLFPSISNAEVHKCHGRVADIVGTPGDDTIYGTDDGTGGQDVIAGLGGNDVIYGLDAEPGRDYVEGWEHGDIICGHGGSDTIYPGCANTCNGGEALGGRGADVIHEYWDGITVYGGPGDDTFFSDGSYGVTYSSARGPITANLSTGVVTGEGTDTLIDVDGVVGTDYGDTLIGGDSSDGFTGGDGDDRIYGRGGNDSIVAGLGNDLIDGGRGGDRLGFGGSPNGVWASLIAGWAEGEGSDTLLRIESLNDSDFDDTLIGNTGDNSLVGGGGTDRLYGRRGNDMVVDQYGDGDQLYGNRGNDWLDSNNDESHAPDLLDAGIGWDTCTDWFSATVRNCEELVDS
jgi:Ca2+-binding RTX toxin-like protein